MKQNNQRIVIGMMDGFGIDYYEKSDMPVLKRLAKEGVFKQVSGIFPSVTNVNNVSICCGQWPDEHGIIANSFYDRESGNAVFMNSSELIRADTLFQRAKKSGVKTALLTSKRKTTELFKHATDICVAAEDPPADFVEAYGDPESIYSAEINWWLWSVAVDLLRTDPEIGLLYVHITDYPMHMWAPDDPVSLQHLSRLDELIGEAVKAAPDAAFLFTADHGMNFKKRCYDLARVCSAQDTPVEFVLSPERDYYIAHHKNYTGCAFVWLNNESDRESVTGIIAGLQGVDSVMDSEKAAAKYHLLPEFMGDLVVFGDRDTMFGDMNEPYEELPPTYRAHGSLHEMDLPLIMYNVNEMPDMESVTHNKDLAAWLWVKTPGAVK
jgi:phosphonoacetate hydrolase